MTSDVLTSIEKAAGRIRLNRPKSLHALTLPMCEAMIQPLLAWREDPAVRIVLIDHAEGRGFCAGGDVVQMAESGKGDGVLARHFFRVEYQLNHLLFTYAKTVVAFMDGVTMGGGVGIAAPARYRVATERTMFAMPEGIIGFFPDVGGGWFFSRLPGRTGQYLALTGARIDGGDCIALGLATHYIPSEALEDVKAALAERPDEVEAILNAAATAAPPSRFMDQRIQIDRLFESDRLEDIIAALEADPSDWAAKQLATLHKQSPQSSKVTLRLLAQGRDHIDFAEEMRVEYRLAWHICQRHDFIEGVRATLVDKDHQPTWQPATAEDVNDGLIAQIFAPLPEDEEWAPL